MIWTLPTFQTSPALGEVIGGLTISLDFAKAAVAKAKIATKDADENIVALVIRDQRIKSENERAMFEYALEKRKLGLYIPSRGLLI